MYVSINWEYHKNVPSPYSTERKPRFTDRTICKLRIKKEISDKGAVTFLSSITRKLGENGDGFNVEKARKFSLAKTMKKIPALVEDKGLRRIVWNAYRERKIHNIPLIRVATPELVEL